MVKGYQRNNTVLIDREEVVKILRTESKLLLLLLLLLLLIPCLFELSNYEGWNFNSGNYLFTTGTK